MYGASGPRCVAENIVYLLFKDLRNDKMRRKNWAGKLLASDKWIWI
jgi:hypothetical protein